MRIAECIDIKAPRELVWAQISDPTQYLHFMHGVTRWEVQGDRAQDVGARYRMLIRVGSAEIGGLIEVTEWVEPTDIAWTSVTGLDQRGRWRLRPAPGSAGRRGMTRVELRMQYGVAGAGIFGWLSEHIAAPTVRGHIRKSLQQLKRRVEHEQLRAAAAERRRARAA